MSEIPGGYVPDAAAHNSQYKDKHHTPHMGRAMGILMVAILFLTVSCTTPSASASERTSPTIPTIASLHCPPADVYTLRTPRYLTAPAVDMSLPGGEAVSGTCIAQTGDVAVVFLTPQSGNGQDARFVLISEAGQEPTAAVIPPVEPQQNMAQLAVDVENGALGTTTIHAWCDVDTTDTWACAASTTHTGELPKGN